MRLDGALLNPPVNRALLLANGNCVYCGRLFGHSLAPTKEHVIGRRFVPKGTLSGEWNLIVRACAPCNAAKSELEDDISAITMMPDPLGRFACDDPRLVAEAARKTAKARSRRTGRTVAESWEPLAIKGTWGPLAMRFDLISPPQIDDERIGGLARMQVGAFFFLCSYDSAARRGGFPTGEWALLTVVRRGDWGNPLARWFERTVCGWSLKFHGIGASGFFKAVIRRRPDDPALWAWAVEWNRDMRVLGFVGSPEGIDELARLAPALPSEWQKTGADEWFSVRVEEPLAPDEDALFASDPPA